MSASIKWGPGHQRNDDLILSYHVGREVQVRANRLSDSAALFMALGGGWPASCTTPVWRQCATGDQPAVISANDKH